MKLAKLAECKYSGNEEVVDCSKEPYRERTVIVIRDDGHIDGYRPSQRPGILTITQRAKPYLQHMETQISAMRNDPAQAWRFSKISDHQVRNCGDAFVN